MAAGSDQATFVESLARDEHARAGREGTGEPVRLVDDDAADAEGLVADLKLVPYLHAQANEQVVGDGDGIGSERVRELARRLEIDGAVVWICLRVDRLE